MSIQTASSAREAGAPRAGSAGADLVGSASPRIVVDSVRMVYRTEDKVTHALERANLSIADGEFVAIVGPSGCGKSTLLRIIAGLLAPTEGHVKVGGQVVNGAVTDLGIVFQTPVLLEWRNILDNVLVQIELRSLPVARYRNHALDLLESVGLSEFRNSYPRELSGGMRQRAAIVRALIHDPPVLLMDEPFGALDALTREQMRVDLEQLWLRGRKTVLFITHSIDEAVLLADRVVVMSPRPGNIEQVFNIDLPRPRGLEARGAPEFDRVVSQITEIFLSRGVLRTGSLTSKPRE